MYTASGKGLIFGTILGTLLWACHGLSDKEVQNVKPEPGTVKAIVFKGLHSTRSGDRVGYLRDLATNLGLPILTGGSHGLTIRIWAWDSSERQWVINLRTTRRDTSCSILSYTYGHKDTTDYIYVHEQRDVTPRSGWDVFWETLRKFQMPDMPRQILTRTRLDEFIGVPNVAFEIDELGQYEYLTYPNPGLFGSEDPACKTVDDFLKYFNQEMGTFISDVGKRTE